MTEHMKDLQKELFMECLAHEKTKKLLRMTQDELINISVELEQAKLRLRVYEAVAKKTRSDA